MKMNKRLMVLVAVAFLLLGSYAYGGCLTVVSPNGGEVWPPGTSHNILWSSSCPPGTNVKIILRKGGARLGRIASGISASEGAYPWVVGQYLGGTAPEGHDYKIVIKTMDNTAIDASDSDFSISSTGQPAYNGGVHIPPPKLPRPIPGLSHPDFDIYGTSLGLLPGGTVMVKFHTAFRNTGLAEATNIPVELNITGPAGSTYNGHKTSMVYPSLPPGMSLTFDKTFEIKTPGKYYFTFTIDPQNKINEADEHNNSITRNITINAPDLIAWLITPRVYMTVEENVWIGVLNIGTAASNATRLKVKIEGKGETEFTVPSLGPCEFKTDFERKEHFWTNEDKWVEMTVDPYGQVRELRKDNNFTKTKLDVRALTSNFGSGLVAPPVNLCLQH